MSGSNDYDRRLNNMQTEIDALRSGVHNRPTKHAIEITEFVFEKKETFLDDILSNHTDDATSTDSGAIIIS